jgi:hypothetical protein
MQKLINKGLKRINPKDLELLLEITNSTARRHFNIMRDALKKKKGQPILLKEAADYLGLNIDDASDKLTPPSKI